MNAAEKIIKMMREQGAYQNGKGLQLANMKDSETVLLGNAELDRECYLKSEGLKLEAGDMVVIYRLDLSTYLLLAKVV